ncbi:MAG: hypothetical protein ACRD00_00955 [Thermoanaerobaculia bacterium]
MRRRRLALPLALAALLALAWVDGSGCRKSPPQRKAPGPGRLPTAAPYKPRPTHALPSPRPGEIRRPTMAR